MAKKKNKINDVVIDEANNIEDVKLEDTSIVNEEKDNITEAELAKIASDAETKDLVGKYIGTTPEDELNLELAEIEDMNEAEFNDEPYSEDELDLLAGANPHSNDESNINNKDNNIKKSNKGWIKYLLFILIMSITAFLGQRYLYYKYDYIPENRSEVHYLDGNKVEEKDLVIDVEYDIEMTDLDTGKVYMRKRTYSDTTAPEIIIDNDEYIFVKKETNLVGGLTITDNYYPYEEIKVTIEGIDLSKEGNYNAIVKAEDGSNNSREVQVQVKVVTNQYISNGILIERDFSNYKTFATQRINPSENIELNKFEEITFEDALSKIENKDSFALFLHFDACPWCQDAKPIIEEVAEELDVTIYHINVRNTKGCEEACTIENPNGDIRKSDDVDYLEWLKTTQNVEYPTVPYMIVYENGEKAGDFFSLEYNAKVRNANDAELDEMAVIYTELLSKLSSKVGE